ncbi:MAG: choice-of-anchor L domain-containing protein [Labilithrix sp.]|nr:choice-of-anchor L domain-containing protein [Labilithrix sp.]
MSSHRRLLALVPIALAVACAIGDDAGEANPTPAPSLPTFDADLDADPTKCRESNGVDDDGDGYTEAEGDCDDCRRAINPGAYDYPGNKIDEDCSGTPDDEPAGCDVGAALDDPDARAAVRALGLCRWSTAGAAGKDKTWGVVAARYVKPDGTPLTEPLSHGILSSFGVNEPRDGKSFLALSSGTARAPDMPGYKDILGFRKGYTSGVPAGYPKESPACPGTVSGLAHDGAALELEIRVPTNVKSFHVDQNFFTVEFPGYVCSKYNDFYVLDMDPKVPDYPDGNVAFDSAGNPISVNNALLQVCKARTIDGRRYDCPLGPSSLTGTGFDTVHDDYSPAPHAATGWLTTYAPAPPGKVIRLRFAIWDSSDGNLDSTVLVDRFEWSDSEQRGTTPSGPR